MASLPVLRSCYIALALITKLTTASHRPPSFQLPPILPILPVHHSTKRRPQPRHPINDKPHHRHHGLIDDFIEEASLERRTFIGEKPVMFASDEDASSSSPPSSSAPTFDFERWEKHRSSQRYTRMLVGVLFGSTTRRIAPTTALLVAFSIVVDYYDFVASPLTEYPPSLSADDLVALPSLQLPIIPFELTAPVLGLLLVFRTDAAYERFKKGSELSWGMTACTRNVVRRIAAWTGRDGCSEEEREAGHDLIDACCLLHGWIMGEYLRGSGAGGDEGGGPGLLAGDGVDSLQLAILQKALNVGGKSGVDDEKSRADAAELAQMGVRMTPSLAMTSISLGAAQRLPSLTDQEHIAIDDGFAELTSALASCEKLLRTPIPLGYTRYAVRFLCIWLVLLPFALVRPFYEFGEQPILVLAMAFISYVFLSIEDIAVQIEEPFVTLPLELHQKWLMWDAEQIRGLMRWSAKERVRRSGGGGGGKG